MQLRHTPHTMHWAELGSAGMTVLGHAQPSQHQGESAQLSPSQSLAYVTCSQTAQIGPPHRLQKPGFASQEHRLLSQHPYQHSQHPQVRNQRHSQRLYQVRFQLRNLFSFRSRNVATVMTSRRGHCTTRSATQVGMTGMRVLERVQHKARVTICALHFRCPRAEHVTCSRSARIGLKLSMLKLGFELPRGRRVRQPQAAPCRPV